MTPNGTPFWAVIRRRKNLGENYSPKVISAVERQVVVQQAIKLCYASYSSK